MVAYFFFINAVVTTGSRTESCARRAESCARWWGPAPDGCFIPPALPPTLLPPNKLTAFSKDKNGRLGAE